MSLQPVSRIPAIAFAVVASVVSAMAHAQGKTAPTVSPQHLKAKTDYCNTCHGLQGQGFRGSLPMPRLAGQQPEYIENQLKAFAEHRRNNRFNVAHALSPAMLKAVITEFKNLDPKPLGGAPKVQIAAGKKIYDEGVADRNIQACASCHGPEAKGDGQAPRLAGQLHDYVIRTLTSWDKERGQDKADPDTSAIMQPIAQDLTPAQIAAVAAYVSTLE
jgi:cytochrome c553